MAPLAELLGQTLGIIFWAWLIRKIARLSADNPYHWLGSILLTGCIALFVGGFGHGEGGFDNRVAHMLQFNNRYTVLAGTLLAIVVTAAYRSIRSVRR